MARTPAWRDGRMQKLPSAHVYALLETHLGPRLLVVRQYRNRLAYVVSHDVQDYEADLPADIRVVMWRRIGKNEQ